MTNRKSIFPLQPTGFPSPTSLPEPTSQISVVETPSLLLLEVLDPSLVVVLALLALDPMPLLALDPTPLLVLPELASLLAAASAVVGGGVVVNGDVSACGPWQAGTLQSARERARIGSRMDRTLSQITAARNRARRRRSSAAGAHPRRHVPDAEGETLRLGAAAAEVTANSSLRWPAPW